MKRIGQLIEFCARVSSPVHPVLGVAAAAAATLLLISPLTLSVNRAEAAENRGWFTIFLCDTFSFGCPLEPAFATRPTAPPTEIPSPNHATPSQNVKSAKSIPPIAPPGAMTAAAAAVFNASAPSTEPPSASLHPADRQHLAAAILGAPDSSQYVTKAELDAALDQRFTALSALVPALQQLISRWPAFSPPTTVYIPTYTGTGSSAPITVPAWAASQRIDNLSGTHLSNVTVSGVSGLSMSDVGLSYASSADITSAGNYTIATWGDSLTSGSGGTPYPAQLAQISGDTIFNGGMSGYTSTQIATRMLVDSSKYSLPTIIWIGRNNYTDLATVKADIASMVAALSSAGNNKYIVLSILNNSTETSSTGNHDTIIQLNNDLAATYGSHYLDIRAYLVSQYDPNQAQDVVDYSNDIVPNSLRSDTIHLNTAGYQLVAQKVYQNINLLRSSFNDSGLVTVQRFRQALGDFSAGFYTQGNRVLFSTSTNSLTAVGIGAANLILPSGLANTAVGYQTLNVATSSDNNTALGYQSLYANMSGSNNTGSGARALFNNLTGSDNTAVGTNASYLNTTGANNISIGGNALYSNGTGGQNVAVGVQSLLWATTTANNTAIGYQTLAGSTAGSFTISGTNNTAIGSQALFSYINASQNTAIGLQSMRYATSSNNNVAVGYRAAYGTSNNDNYQGITALGYQTGYNLANGSDYNTLLGYQAGYGITTGSNNIWIGAATSSTSIANLTTGSQNILIGNNISLASSTGSGQLNIGNIIYGTGITGTGSTLSSGSTGIGTTTPWRKFAVTGTVGFDGLTSAVGAGSLCLTTSKEVVYNSGSDACLPSLRSTKHDITALTIAGTTTLAALLPVSFIYNGDASSTVRYGFIADDAITIDPHFGTYDAHGQLSGIDDRSILAVIVKAVQELIAQVRDLAATVASFADSFTSHRVSTDELCVTDGPNDPSAVCLTKPQLAALLSQSTAAGLANPTPTSPQSQFANPTPTPNTPPVITIAGANPAHIRVRDSYIDLGATARDAADHDLGLKYFLNGALVSDIVIDTTEATTDTIDYVATDTNGLTSTSTRTVIIEAAAAEQPTPPPPSPEPASAPEAATPATTQ